MVNIDSKLRFKCGIYCIFNMQNGKRYIGSSKDIYNRWHEHIHHLNNGTAHNAHLQNAWNKYGSEYFLFGVLEYCSIEERFTREQYYIDMMHPEYNFSLNVIANLDKTVSEETREKISSTLKAKYASGEITTYKQEHAWVKCYIYNISTWKLEAECDNLAEAAHILGLKDISSFSRNKVECRLFGNIYIISITKYQYLHELQNHVYKNIFKYIGTKAKYVITDTNGVLRYYRSMADCARANNCSSGILTKHNNATIDNPYIIRKTGAKFFLSNEYIPLSETAVQIEKSSGLLLGNIGENPNRDTAEISIETKESIPSYSIEGEP